MKEFGLIIASFLLLVSGFAQSSRQTIYFKNLEWKLYSKNEKIEVEKAYSEAIDFSLEQSSKIDSTNLIVAKLYMDEILPAMIAFYDYGDEYEVFINDIKLKNELEGDNFYAEVGLSLLKGNDYIVLKPKQPIDLSNFKKITEFAQIALLDGMVFSKFELKPDTYFGGKMLSVTVRNFNTKDLDGKIYAKLYDFNDWTLITENNNCAFSRAGEESKIDIVFPEKQAELIDRKVMLELTIVDKENNEEIVDQLILPVKF